MAKAEFEVRITPLMRGVPGGMEVDGAPTGVTVIEEADTTLVEQYLDLEVNHELNEFRTGTVVLSIHDPVVADLEPFAQAVWIGYKRPLETVSEAILYGQCNVVTNYADATVTLEIQDPSLRLQHHYVRRGDEALNVDKNRGRLEQHASSFFPIVEAARNIDLQQDRDVPALGLYVDTFYVSSAVEDAPFIDFERGQECWDLIQQIVRGVGGPDIDIYPEWSFPTSGRYAILDAHDPADPPNPSANALARNLDPADPDDPQTGEVVFDFGIGQDNLEALEERPTRPTTHAHVLDEPAVYRETSADAESSEDVGVFVDWIATGFAIRLPQRGSDGLGNHTVIPADTTPLRAIADAHIKAYGRPPRFLTLTLRPDDALGFHYGHPGWYLPTEDPQLGGEWYIGDYVRVRGVRGERSVNELQRIVGVKFKYDLQRDLVLVDVSTVPTVGGTPGTDLEEVATGGGSGAIAPGDPVATATPTGVAIATGIRPTAFEASPQRTALGVATATGISPTDTQVAVGANLVRSLDRRLKLASNGTTFSARGVNAHVGGFAWGQSNYSSMQSQGINAQRLCVNWKRVETSPGVFSTTELNYIQQAIDRAAAANIKTIICLGINSPQWAQRASYLPSWSYGSSGPITPVAPWDNASLFDTFISMGEAYSRKMVQQFGANVNVIAFDPWNEPDHQPASEVHSGLNRWLGWVRDEPNGAGKLWLITNSYSSQSAGTADNNWNAIADYTNCVLHVHSYFAPTSTTDDGWNSSNGMREGPFWNGSTIPSSYNTANKASMRLHFAPWKLKAQALGIPWILGEFGVEFNQAAGSTERDNWARDMVEAAELEECAGVFWWIYGTNSSQDPWSAAPGGVWRPEAVRTSTFDAF